MKTGNKRLVSLLTCIVLILTLSLGSAGTASAAGNTASAMGKNVLGALQTGKEVTATATSDPIYLANNGTFKPANLNGGTAKLYYSPSATSSSYTYTYYVDMPKPGTLQIAYAASTTSTGGSAYISAPNLDSAGSKTNDDGVTTKRFIVYNAGPVQIQFTLYKGNSNSSACMLFAADYAPNTINTVKAPTGKFSSWYYHGGTYSTNTTTKFKVKAAYTGYLVLDLQDADGENGYSVSYKVTGFKDYDSCPISDIRRYIGVQKGKTYTFTIKTYAPIYAFRVRLYKVTQGKYGSKKSAASAIKKKALRKGIIWTNNKKVHWYKIVNPKLQKVNVKIGMKMSAGEGGKYSGGLKVTFYDKKGSMGYSKINATYASKKVNLYTTNSGGKLRAGTYWIKVESYGGGNGYFTVKWTN